MYNEEKMINGVLYWRTNPNAQFQAYTPQQLSYMLNQERQRHYETSQQLINSNPAV